MSETGGSTTQSGIFYQNTVAAIYLSRLCDARPCPDQDRVVKVRVEAPEDVDDSVVTFADGFVHYIQAKESVRYTDKKIWATLWEHFDTQIGRPYFQKGRARDRIILQIGTYHPDHDELSQACNRARGSDNFHEWQSRLTTSQKKLIDNIRPLLHSMPSDADFLDFFKHVYVVIEPLEFLESSRVAHWMPPSNSQIDTVFGLLRDRVGGRARIKETFTAQPLRDDLARRNKIVFILPFDSNSQEKDASVVERVPIEESEALAAVFVPPVQYEDAKRIVLRRNIVIITGPPHIGKTATALYLAREVQNEKGLRAIVRLNPEDDLQQWFQASNLVLVLDDCFGAVSFSRQELANSFPGVIRRLSKRNHVICTTRTPILDEAKETTRFGEDSEVEQQIIELSVDGSYGDEELLRILQSHLTWVQSEHAEDQERIRSEQAQLVLRRAHDVIERLRFPHNIERLCRAHLTGVENSDDLEQAIELAREIERAVEKWAEALADNERWFVFVIALFGGTRANTLERIYGYCAEAFGFSPQDIGRLLDKHSAYIVNRIRPQFGHPSYSEAIIKLMRRRYARSVGRVVDRGLFWVLQEDMTAFSRCSRADYGWPRPADFDPHGEAARVARDEAMEDPNVRPFPLNPYLEQLSEAYAILRNRLFQGIKPILDPCHCPHDGVFLVLVPPISNEFGLLIIPGDGKAPPYTVERVEDVRARLDQLLDEANQAYIPVHAEILYPHDTGQRSPQMHALLLIRRQIEYIFQKQRLPESEPMTQLRIEQVLREFNLQDCVGTPHEWRFRTDWKNSFTEDDFKRLMSHFKALDESPNPTHLDPEIWKRMKSGYARSAVRLGRAFQSLQNFGASYTGPLIPQFDRTETEFSGPLFSYTPEGMYKAVHQSLEAILESYRWLVESAFGPLRAQMPSYKYLPFKVVGAVNFTRDTNDWMQARTLVYILPSDFETQNDKVIELHIQEVKKRDTTDWETSGSERFPELVQERLKAAQKHGILRAMSPYPDHFRRPEKIIALIYEWLHDDLNAAMGWGELGSKRNSFLRSVAEAAMPGNRNILWDMTHFADPWEFEDWKR